MQTCDYWWERASRSKFVSSYCKPCYKELPTLIMHNWLLALSMLVSVAVAIADCVVETEDLPLPGSRSLCVTLYELCTSRYETRQLRIFSKFETQRGHYLCMTKKPCDVHFPCLFCTVGILHRWHSAASCGHCLARRWSTQFTLPGLRIYYVCNTETHQDGMVVSEKHRLGQRGLTIRHQSVSCKALRYTSSSAIAA